MTQDQDDLYASTLRLSRNDVKALNITDAYSLHRVVYDLYSDVRNRQQKQASTPSGILYADKGGDINHRLILLLAERQPNPNPVYGKVRTLKIPQQFLQHRRYAFTVTVNPSRRDSQTGKIIAVRSREAIRDWFIERAESSWGFGVNPVNLQIDKLSVQSFKKDGQSITHGSAGLKGELQVMDQARFMQSFRQGIGRGRAFGFGLLQIVPI
ncbi:MAG: type I-E CRISPR-associated protein Cas6/Cse3/CasE [Methylococcales bacterium]|nr:type I-E CRISPR-associated protein Cas6/Cse3/CasE [Methylococcales bacterium]